MVGNKKGRSYRMDGIFGSRFIGARTPAWHALGEVIQPDKNGKLPSVKEMVRRAGIDFEYVKVPVGYTTPSGLFVASEDRNIVLRSPVADDDTWRELGVVGKDFEFIQNLDLAQGLDNLTKETGWTFETVGALGYGETVFMTLRTGKKSVFGDNFDTYVIVSDGKAGSRALTITIAFVRVVCQNTLLMSDSAALNKFKISHNGEVEQNYSFWLELIAALQKSQDETFARMEELATVKIEDEEAMAIIEAAYPLPKKNQRVRQAEAIQEMTELSVETRAQAAEKLSAGLQAYDAAVRRVQLRREGTFSLYERISKGQEQGSQVTGVSLSEETLEQIAWTPYAALNAVTEMADWGGAANAIDGASSSLFGDAADVKDRAFQAAYEYVRVR